MERNAALQYSLIQYKPDAYFFNEIKRKVFYQRASNLLGIMHSNCGVERPKVLAFVVNQSPRLVSLLTKQLMHTTFPIHINLASLLYLIERCFTWPKARNTDGTCSAMNEKSSPPMVG